MIRNTKCNLIDVPHGDKKNNIKNWNSSWVLEKLSLKKNYLKFQKSQIIILFSSNFLIYVTLN